jgi:pyrroloquinoline quinone biosynthesis protein B
MKVIVLGAAAGGGFPQWNAASANNLRAFAGAPECPNLTQCSLAVSSNGDHWVLLNASPDLRQQIIATPELHPKGGLRSSPITAVVLAGADVDAIAGLLTLRERQGYTVWATDYVARVIAANPIFKVLDPSLVHHRRVPREGSFEPLPGLTCRAFEAPGKPPLYLEASEGIGAVAGACTGLRLTSAGKTLVFLPSCADVTSEVRNAVDRADLLFFDGTMLTDDEMIRSGEGVKTARRMGHVAMSGTDGAIAALRGLDVASRYFIHINNSNPVLNRASPERRAVEDAGWQIAEDGMRIEL